MRLLIHSKITGLPYDIVLQDGMMKPFNTSDTYDFCMGDRSSSKSVEGLLKLHDYELEDLVPSEYRNSFKECGYSGEVPWSYAIPTRKYKELLLPFLKKIQDVVDCVEESTYSEFFQETNEIFSLLKPCRFDERQCKDILGEADNHVISSLIKMSKGGLLPPPSYSRSSTKTGRLVVKKGPQILTLKKEHRSVLKPCVEGNKLYEIDFVSLEPRVALNLAGESCGEDVYESFASASGLEVSRDVSKLAVLCALYGAGKYRLEGLLGKEDSKVSAKKLIESVKEYFKVRELSRELETQAKEGKILNYFGRPIDVDDARPSILVNNFLQSSAVDIALVGFLDFCRLMNGSIRPLYIIHDALVFEADPKNIAHVIEYVDNGYEVENLGKFPLKITEMNSHG